MHRVENTAVNSIQVSSWLRVELTLNQNNTVWNLERSTFSNSMNTVKTDKFIFYCCVGPQSLNYC